MLKLLQGSLLAIGLTVVGVHSCSDDTFKRIEQIITGPACVCPVDQTKKKLEPLIADQQIAKKKPATIAKKKIHKSKFSGGSHHHKSHGSHHHKSFPPSHGHASSPAPSHAPAPTPPSTGPPCCP
jgi:hypothetical protein